MSLKSNLTILVGHRGVGKTSLLQRLARLFPQAQCFCLDHEIEKRHGHIIDYFAQKGEAEFREREREVFAELVAQTKLHKDAVVIAVGGGFRGPFPDSARLIWVKRDWDTSQNIYFDRPSLNANTQDLRMPRELFEQRETFFQSLAAEELILPEGIYHTHPGEVAYYSQQVAHGCVTLLPEHFSKNRRSALLAVQPDWFEVRDDILSVAQIRIALEFFPLNKILFSFRDINQQKMSLPLATVCGRMDWPLDWGEPPTSLEPQKVWRSLHSEEDSYFDALEVVEGFEGAAKWAPLVKNFLQLRLGHEWMMRKPHQRVFLPRSEDGRWAWYRHSQKNHLALNFWREGFGSSMDQPTLLQWYQPSSLYGFAAVLGDPVLQSWSPAFHAEFWAKKGMSLYAIEINEQDLQDGGFEFLQTLGLKAAAVTSPLKMWAAEIARQTQPLNTLVQTAPGVWQGWNTDALGFADLWNVVQASGPFKNVVVWGGGGILPSLNLPKAIHYSARTGKPREGFSALENPDLVVWAAGYDKGNALPSTWKPRMVIDLNYRLDSPAREWAHRWQAQYCGGESHFVRQALEQQKIWSAYE